MYDIIYSYAKSCAMLVCYKYITCTKHSQITDKRTSLFNLSTDDVINGNYKISFFLIKFQFEIP